MFEDLSAAIDDLVIPVDGPALAEVFGLRDRLDVHLVEAVWLFDESGAWAIDDGAASVAAYLRHACRLTNAEAFRIARLARRLRRLPVLFAAWRDGTLSGGQIQVICANLTDRITPVFAAWEARLVPQLATMDIHETTVVMRSWAAKAKASLDDESGAAEPDPDRTAHLSPMLDGTGRLDANLDPEAYQAALAALRLAMGGRPAPDDERTAAQRRHDALAAIFGFFLDHQTAHLGGRHRPHVNITVALAALLAKAGHGEHLDGTTITAEDARRLACDANIHRVITRADGTILDYGRATRVVSAAMFMVLCLRDQHCRFPGCNRPCHQSDAHHVLHWIDHGETKIANLVLLCRWHHQVIHRKGWSMHLLADATVVVVGPDGRRRTSHPPGWTQGLDLTEAA